MPSETFSHRVHIDAPQDAVWKQLQIPETWTGLGPVQRVWDPEWRGDLLVAYKFAAEAGPRRFEGTASTRDAAPPECLVVDIAAPGMKGELRARLTANASGTVADIALAIGTSDAMLSLLFGIIASTIRKQFPAQVEHLATQIAATKA